ncbi:MAG: hypothetical protein KAR18_08955 [Spirochaetes bacterium]|nr:hypothetical protein [Spirochaetota bacterium]
MKTIKYKEKLANILINPNRGKIDKLRRSRIENLKTMINNEDYVNQAIAKLANSLTYGLMK